jgi:ABC-type nitrate/sulfonate/bicarbonate transport system permease component
MSAVAASSRHVVEVRPSGRARAISWIVRIVSLACLLALWQWYGSKPDVFAFAPPTEVVRALWSGLTTGDLASAVLGLLQAAAVGYVIAAVIGVGAGLLIGLSQGWARNTIEPLAYAIYATPMSLFIPVLAIYTGLGFRGQIVLVVLWCVFEILINTIAGVREVPTPMVEAGRVFGASKWKLYRSVVLPAAFPFIITGLRMGVGRAIRGAVTAELLLSVVHIGSVLVVAQATYDMPTLLATIVLVMLIGMFFMRIAEIIERRILAWRHA